MVNIDSRLLSELDANELYLLCWITNRIGSNKDSWPGNETLLKETGWHIEKLLKVKKSLEIKGIISVARRRGFSNRYSLKTSLIKNYNGNSDNGKSVVPGVSDDGKSVPGTTENPESVHRKSDNDHFGKSDKEVLTTEVLINEELTRKELTSKRERLIFTLQGEIIECLYPRLNDFKFTLTEGIENLTIRKQIQDIWGTAEEILTAFEVVTKEPVPEYRLGAYSSKDEVSPFNEAIDQLQAYADFNRLKKLNTPSTPERIPQLLVGNDWCEKLKNWAEDGRNKYDVYEDMIEHGNLKSEWLFNLKYFPIVAYANRVTDEIRVD